MKAAFPSRSILLLVGIGLIDLVSTAWFYSRGMIVEMNPLMRVLLERGEWLFVVVKALTLLATWFVLVHYAKHNLKFVRSSCCVGSAVYLAIWLVWFTAGRG
jgi:hypothetical protein